MRTEQIPYAQLYRGMLSLMLIQTFYTFPRGVAVQCSTATPWALLMAGGLSFLLIWPVLSALARRPGKNLTDLALESGGRPLAILAALAVGSFLVIGAGLNLREAAEMAVTSLFPHTPQTFAMVTLAVAAGLGAAISPGGLYWIGSLVAFPVVYGIILVLIGNLGWGQFRDITPFAGPGLLPVVKSLFPMTSYYGELVCLAIIASYAAAPKRLVRSGAVVVAVSAVAWAVSSLMYLMVFPLPGGLDVPFPLFEMSRLVTGGRFFERVDGLWIIFWTLGSAGRTAAQLMGTALLLKGAFRLPNHYEAVPALVITMMAIALFPENQQSAIHLEALVVRYWGYLAVMVLPLVIALIAMMRRRLQHA